MTGRGRPWEWLWWVWEHLGAPETTLGAPGSTWECRRQAWEPQWQALEPQRQVWEHLESHLSSVGQITSSLGMLLVLLEIIATTYCSMVFKTDVFSLYSHLCIYIATHLHTVYLDWLQAVLESNLRCAWTWSLTENKDALWDHDRATLEMHLEAMMMQT